MSEISTFFLSALKYSVLRYTRGAGGRFRQEYPGGDKHDASSDYTGPLLFGYRRRALGGLALTDAAIGAVGFLLMLAADAAAARAGGGWTGTAIRAAAGVYCLVKFVVPGYNANLNLLKTFFIVYSFFSDFFWSLTLVFLLLFEDMVVLIGEKSKDK